MRKKLKSNPPHVLSPAQLVCLGAAPQRAIVELLAREAPLTRGDIAARLGRPATSTHYQLGRLIQVGLVVADDCRRTTRRPEVLYRLVSNRLVTAEATGAGPGRDALAQTGRRIAAAAGRDLTRAVAAGAAVSGPDRRAAVHRLLLRLDDDSMEHLNVLLDAFVSRAKTLTGDDGAVASLTIILGDGQPPPRPTRADKPRRARRPT